MITSDKVYIKRDTYNRIYLCIPHNTYGYVCYKKAYILEREVTNPTTIPTKISAWIPEFMDTYILKKRLECKDLCIVQSIRQKEWEGCFAAYTAKSIVVRK